MENAELYSSANGMQKKDAQEILMEFKDKLKWTNGTKILDIGCGSGEVTTEILLPCLPKDFGELVGLDISLEMIQHARNLHSHPKVTFVQFDIAQNSDNLLEELSKTISASKSDILSLKEFKRRSHETESLNFLFDNQDIFGCREIESESKKPGYDIVSSFYCLHWISNQRLAVRNIYKLLKPGGECLLVFLVKSPIFTLYRKLSTIDLWKYYMQDVDNFIPFYQHSEHPLENFTEILHTTGFETIVADCREKKYVFDSILSLRNAIAAVNPFLSRLPSQELQNEFINECLRQIEYLKLTELKNNSYIVSYKLLVAHIRKPLNTL